MSKVFIYELLLQEQFKYIPTEIFNHVLKAGERNIEKSSLRIEPTLQNEGVEMWVPP